MDCIETKKCYDINNFISIDKTNDYILSIENVNVNANAMYSSYRKMVSKDFDFIQNIMT